MPTLLSPKPASALHFISLLLVQVILFGIIALGFLGSYNSTSLIILFPTIAYGIARLSLLGQSDEPQWGLILLWLYGLYIALIPGMVQITNESYYWPIQGDYSEATVFMAVAIMCLGLCLADASYNLNRQKTVQNPPKQIQSFSPNIPVLAAFVGLGALWSGYLVSTFGLGFFLQTRGAVGSVLGSVYSKAELGMQVNLGTSLLMALLVVFIDLITNPSNTKKSRALWCLFAIVIILNIIINSPLRMARYVLFALILAILFVLYKNNVIKSKLHFWLILVFAPALYFIFRFMGVFARGETTNFTLAISNASDIKQTLSHGDFDGIQMNILGINHIMENGLHWGQQILGSIFFFIPREIWPAKATPSNALIAESNGQLYTNLSSSFFLEGYLDWGWLGVILMAIIMGKILAMIDRSSIRDMSSVTAIFFVAFLPIIMRGALLAVIAPITATLFWCWLMSRTGYNKQKSNRS